MTYRIAALVLALLFALPVAGDVLKDADRMLYVPGPVFHCVADGACNSGAPEDENIPDFIEVDLKRKTLAANQAQLDNFRTAFTTCLEAKDYIAKF